MSSRNIKIIFIRHAQSEENDKFYDLMKSIDDIKSFQLPTFNQLSNSIQLLRCNLDSSISNTGKQQINDMKNILISNNFWINNKPDVILHSQLVRTKETLDGLLPDNYRNDVLIMKLDSLREAMPHEYLIKRSLNNRMKEFINWLNNSSYNNIIVVGHGQYIRRLLNSNHIIHNCDVWECNYLTSNQSTSLNEDKQRFTNIKLLYRTTLSHTYPSENDITYSNSDVDINEKGENDEPTCRICQTMLSEDPSKKMIRPCKCSGTLSYVHIDCLNEWRATSTVAKYKCPTCQYNYIIQSSMIADILMNDYTCIVVTLIIFVVLVFLIGFIMKQICSISKINIYKQLSTIKYLKQLQIENLDIAYYCYSNYSKTKLLQNRFNELTIYNKISYLYKLYDSNRQYLNILILCYDPLISYIEIIMYGSIVIGPLGLINHIYNHVLAHGFGQREMIMIVSASTIISIRITIFAGYISSFYVIYEYLHKLVSKLGKYIGEKILEPY